MTTKIACPRCHNYQVTDGSSRVIAVLGVIVVSIGLFVLFGLSGPHQITDWTQFTALEGHDCRALLMIALGTILVWGGLDTQTLCIVKCAATPGNAQAAQRCNFAQPTGTTNRSQRVKQAAIEKRTRTRILAGLLSLKTMTFVAL
jgi:hypothetical protein